MDAIRTQRNEGRLAIFLDACGSETWSLQQVGELKRGLDISQVRYRIKNAGESQHYQMMHNPSAQSFSLMESLCFQAWEAEAISSGPTVIQGLTLCIKAGLAQWGSLQFPVGKEEQHAWVLQCLLHSTRGFSKPGVAANIGNEVQKLLNTVSCGKESERLLHVLEFCDFRGSEVTIRDGTVNEGLRQVIPYPAMVWAWRSLQAYAWKQPHHINVLEFNAFFNYLRACVRKPVNHSNRMLHVLDSRVASCVIAKGRSSSCKLNRILRPVSALLLASNVYVFPLWTVSGWNFADYGTRALCPVGS